MSKAGDLYRGSQLALGAGVCWPKKYYKNWRIGYWTPEGTCSFQWKFFVILVWHFLHSYVTSLQHCENLFLNFCLCQNFAARCLWSCVSQWDLGPQFWIDDQRFHSRAQWMGWSARFDNVLNIWWTWAFASAFVITWENGEGNCFNC